MADLERDLQARWRPSDEQIALADALLWAGYDADRPGGHRGVFTAHLLLNKRWGAWTADVEVIPLDGVFLNSIEAMRFARAKGSDHFEKTSQPVCGGYAWHRMPGRWAVWDDIGGQFPEETT